MDAAKSILNLTAGGLAIYALDRDRRDRKIEIENLQKEIVKLGDIVQKNDLIGESQSP